MSRDPLFTTATLLLFALTSHAAPQTPSLLSSALEKPLKNLSEIVFATRTPGADPHWYANFGYWSEDASRPLYTDSGSRLLKLNLRTNQLTTLLADPKGSIRDPQVHYDAKKILFSYRKANTPYFHLYEINTDGSNLREITTGPFDDIEPTYLPNDDIAFCSSRCKRWVNCWYTQVAVLYRCDNNGQYLRPISSNTEHDNTPAILPDGRILYTRWEYVDRSQVEFHHLWTTNPDGTNAQTYFGNLHPGVVMIDSKPIPGTAKVLSIFSPGHGVNEHRGKLTIVSPELGPDTPAAATPVKGCPDYVRDPYPLNQSLFLVAHDKRILLVDSAAAKSEPLYTDTQDLHEPAPILPRTREQIITDRTKLNQSTGRLILANAHLGRNMAGVNPGDVKKLLVLESLPKPVNFSGGPNPLTYLGTFTLERALGTVPVEPDGSAFFELPANRQFFFVALDKNDLSIKRMQSWTSVMPGETTSCIGCHEHRTQTAPVASHLLATRRPPSQITPFPNLPDVIDFPRDIQPVLNQHCVPCHSYDKPDGGIILTGDHGPQFSHSHWMLIFSNQVADGANAYGNRPPRSIGSAASPLLTKLTGSHYNVKLAPDQYRLVWLWIESGATYSGTYASLATGMTHVSIFPVISDSKLTPADPASQSVLDRRCYPCHYTPLEGQPHPKDKLPLPAYLSRRSGQAAYERVVIKNDPMLRRGSQILFNLPQTSASY